MKKDIRLRSWSTITDVLIQTQYDIVHSKGNNAENDSQKGANLTSREQLTYEAQHEETVQLNLDDYF
jgi:hypothetical protein